MAKESIRWAKANGYSGNVSKVWWTARPGSMSEAVGAEVDQKKNPTDILVKFSAGPANGWLGLSAKATKGKGDIGFKNPGIGSMEQDLGIQLFSVIEKMENEAVDKLKLPASKSERKEYIRKHKNIQLLEHH